MPVVSVVFLDAKTIHFGLLGLATGSLYALVALGIVLVYRSSGVLNFSATGVGAIAAFQFYTLRDGHGVNWIIALLVALAEGGLLGAFTQVALMRVLGRASLLAKLIATLGLMAAAQGVIDIVWGDSRGIPNGFLPVHLVQFGHGIDVTEDRLVIIGAVIFAVIGLRIVYSKTLFGLATSAVAESRLVASTSGWSPTAIELVNFTVAGLLSALAAILLAPIITLDASALVFAVLPALAAALCGRFSSFGVTVAAALAIGVVQSLLQVYSSSIASSVNVSAASLANIPQVAPLIVILIILVASGRARAGRGEIMARLPLPGSGRVRPIQLGVGGIIGIVLLFVLSPAWDTALTVTFAFGIVVLSVVLVTGFAGQLSLCQFALAGFGCWVAARLATGEGFTFLLALLVAVIATIILGLLVAVPAMRTRGVNLGVATLAVAMVLSAVIFTNGSLTGGFNGLVVKSPTVFGISVNPITHPGRYGALSLISFVLLGLLVSNIRRGDAGRRLLAIRSNERAAASLGVGIYGAKLYAFAVAGGITAVAGVLIGFSNPNVQLQTFDVPSNISVILYAVLGGVGWASGAVIGGTLAPGAASATLLQDLFHAVTTINYWLALFTGLNVLLLLRQAPDGLAAVNAQLATLIRSRFKARDGTTSPLPMERITDRRPAVELTASNVTVRFGGVLALDDVSFGVKPGEVVGLMGSNGAGKTTLIDVLSGFTKPTTGRVALGGEYIEGWTPEKRSRSGLARSWQSVELFEEMTVRENLLVAADSNVAVRYLTDLVRPRKHRSSRSMEAVIGDFDIGPHLEERPSSLPQGTARLVGIARALVTEPSVVLLDEPAAGLDAEETRELGAVIRRVAHEQGLGVLLVEHDVGLLMDCCDRIVALDFGKVIAMGTPDDVARHPDVIRAYLGVPPGGTISAGATQPSLEASP